MNDNLQALTDAIAILQNASISKEIVNGSNFAYSLLIHAERYLNDQIKAYFAPEEIEMVA